MAPFTSPKEFRRVFDELFSLLSRDREAGPRLREKRVPQRFVFTDVGLVLNVRDADEKRAGKGEHLVWTWGAGKGSWEPKVTLEMTADVANRYFQGKENIPLAVARGRIRIADGDLRDVLDLLPIVLPFHPKWVRHLKSSGQLHLLA
ncbi:MAG TPA: hypothetical protein PK598_14630 [Thermoanaerobaculia bacterium]|nr:hypothetical protein [Thermoanaerobaculia bacterium]